VQKYDQRKPNESNDSNIFKQNLFAPEVVFIKIGEKNQWGQCGKQGQQLNTLGNILNPENIGDYRPNSSDQVKVRDANDGIHCSRFKVHG